MTRTSINTSSPYITAYECWKTESAGSRASTHERYLHTVNALANFLNQKPITEISRKDISAFSDHLIQTGNSPVTSKQKIGILKTIFNAAINKELLESNPINYFKLPYKRPYKPRVGFTVDELDRIFQSPIYTQGYLPLGGGKLACFWLPLLALHTGARVEELAQLTASDVRFAKGLGYYLSISDLNGAGAQLKNEHSRRNIPIHASLIACGFMKHVQAQKDQRFLFPDLKINPRGKRGGYFSYFFSGYLRRKIGITDTRKVFHSFRHTFKDNCRKIGIEEAIHDALTGHKSVSVSRNYGNDQFPLEPLFKAIEIFDIPGLDLSHLFEQPLAHSIQLKDIKIVSAFYGLAVGFPIQNFGKSTIPILVAIEKEQTIAIDLSTLHTVFGELAQKKWMLLNAWIQIHREELLLNWQTGKNQLEFFPIDPLR